MRNCQKGTTFASFLFYSNHSLLLLLLLLLLLFAIKSHPEVLLMKIFFIKKACNVVFQSSKNE